MRRWWLGCSAATARRSGWSCVATRPACCGSPPVADPADTEVDLERAEQLALVQRALVRLSPEKREAFLLKHVEGLSYEEMAAVTGERIPTLKMRVHRAREALLRVLEGQE